MMMMLVTRIYLKTGKQMMSTMGRLDPRLKEYGCFLRGKPARHV